MKNVLFFIICFLHHSEGCWLYDKQTTVDKIKKNLALLGRSDVDRDFFKEQMSKMPKVFSWAVHQIGVESAFTNCDSNQDGIITLNEMRKTSTCLDSCFKLSVINFAI
tara:strand:- start:833 stop:1156 length:324 start_codon:yes stop_codon:yes gene_type:complete